MGVKMRGFGSGAPSMVDKDKGSKGLGVCKVEDAASQIVR